MARVVNISGVTNGGKSAIDDATPYQARVTIEGSSDILFHRWNCDAVEAKSAAPRGSVTKKTDDVESYMYRDEAGFIAIPGQYIKGALTQAGRSIRDPRTTAPKMGVDLVKQSVHLLTSLASTGVKAADYLDRQRVVVNKAGITRERPALRKGWKATFDIQVELPQYLPPPKLNELLAYAGKFVGIADFRPTFGRFQVTSFEVL